MADEPDKTPEPKKRTASFAKLEAKLQEFLAAPVVGFTAAGDAYCAAIFQQRGPVLVSAWVDLAEENPAVKRVLENLTKGGAWGGVVISTLAIAWPVAAHHNLVPFAERAPDPFAQIFPPLEGVAPAYPPGGDAAPGAPRAPQTGPGRASGAERGSADPSSGRDTPPVPGAEGTPGPAATSTPDAPPNGSDDE